MEYKDERNGQYYSHRPEPYGDPPQRSEHPPQQSGYPSPSGRPIPSSFPPPPAGYIPGGRPIPSSFPPPPAVYIPVLPPLQPPTFKPYLPQPYGDPPQGSEHPLPPSRYHPQPYGDPPQGSEHPLPPSRYHPQLSQYSPSGYPSPRSGRILQTYISLPPPSFKPSRQLRASIENQTDVAMGITKQLLLTLGKDKNMVYSPLSIHVVLSMILVGTKGHMQDQMLSFLKSKSINEINDLASNVVPLVFADGSSKGGPRLSFANGVWVEKSIHVKPGFRQVLDTTYKASLNQVDFMTRAEEMRCEVNSWAENETEGLIKEIIPAGLVNSETRLILANALYFKGSWEQKFDESMTRVDNFYLLNGRSVKAPFMSSWKSQFISAFEGFKVLKLRYEQGRDYERHFSMYVFLPNARNGLEALVERVCSESGFIDSHLPKHKAGGIFLIPKFKISAGFDAVEVLNHLGLHLNDLTEMVEGEDTTVSKILHKAYIDVNEEGTEAAAATVALGPCYSAATPPPIDFVADHPFLYLIREEVTGTVLFIGHVLNPIPEEAI